MSFRLLAICFAAICAIVLQNSQPVRAATLSSVDVDRTVSIASGTGVLSTTGTGLSLSSFGPTATLTASGQPLFPSITITGDDAGVVSFLGLGFPPADVLGGDVVDTATSANLLEILFETAGGDFFVLDITSVLISGAGLTLNPPFTDIFASLSVFSAQDTTAAPIPLPASGWLLATLMLYLGGKSVRLRKA